MVQNTGRNGAASANLMKKNTSYSDVAEAKVLAHLRSKNPQDTFRAYTTREEQQMGDIRWHQKATNSTSNVEVKTTGWVARTDSVAIEEIQNVATAQRNRRPDGWAYKTSYDHMIWYLPNNTNDLYFPWMKFRSWYMVNRENYELKDRNRTGTTSKYRNIPVDDILEYVEGSAELLIGGRDEDAARWNEWVKMPSDAAKGSQFKYEVTDLFNVL